MVYYKGCLLQPPLRSLTLADPSEVEGVAVISETSCSRELK